MKLNKKVKSTLLSIILILILFIGSDSAYAIRLKISTPSVNENEATITADIDIEQNDRIPINNVTIQVEHSNGTIMSTCTYALNGTSLTNQCSDFQITNINTKKEYTIGYGYGYGYGIGPNYTPTGYHNVSYGYAYGYGYSSGYTQSSSTGSEFKYNITYTAPTTTSDTTYTITMTVNTDEFTYMLTQDKTFTINGTPEEEKSVFLTAGTSVSHRTLKDLKNTLGSDVKSYKIMDETTTTETINITADQISEEFASYGQDTIDTLNQEISGRNIETLDITTKVEVLEITRNDGTISNYTRITRTFNNAGNITVIEILPKSIISSASQITGNFTIIQDDPIIEFIIGPNGELSYILDGEKDTTGIKTMGLSGEKEVIEEPIPEEDVVDEEEEEEEEPIPEEDVVDEEEEEEEVVEEEPKGTNLILIIGIIVIIAIIVLLKKYEKI